MSIGRISIYYQLRNNRFSLRFFEGFIFWFRIDLIEDDDEIRNPLVNQTSYHSCEKKKATEEILSNQSQMPIKMLEILIAHYAVCLFMIYIVNGKIMDYDAIRKKIKSKPQVSKKPQRENDKFILDTPHR